MTMDMSFVLIKLIIVFCFILSLLISNAETSNDLIFNICKKTRSPKLCSEILRSNRRARKASSLAELLDISMEMGKSSAQATKNMIIISRLRTRDRETKERYKSCVTNYDSAAYYLKLANYYLKNGDYVKVSRYIAAALNEPVSCRQNFGRPERVEPEGLKEGNDKLECLCSFGLVISNSLSGKNLSFAQV
ncbi:hypothetical protein BUALT_Bualt14G0131400 [Buddleja alternifolia]|uniref:Pectinesterase inhibitor domain-containing protein n=1 Tax=Buddleja alternifolia TaxID=168488 RepID=A0AAV6WU96_9LAMI|nr:hypothetical protein BUALT_Bualt14G0131400 [Buddleja alternifolia]